MKYDLCSPQKKCEEKGYFLFVLKLEHHWVKRDLEKSHCYTISPHGSIKLILPLTSMMKNSEPHKCY